MYASSLGICACTFCIRSFEDGVRLFSGSYPWQKELERSKVASKMPMFTIKIREKQRGGGKLRGGKHTIKPLPKNGFGPPHLWYDFPPPFVYAMSFSLEETGTNQTNPTFWGLQNWFWRGGFMVRFPPTQNRTIRFAPPFANSQQEGPCFLFESPSKQDWVSFSHSCQKSTKTTTTLCWFCSVIFFRSGQDL